MRLPRLIACLVPFAFAVAFAAGCSDHSTVQGLLSQGDLLDVVGGVVPDASVPDASVLDVPVPVDLGAPDVLDVGGVDAGGDAASDAGADAGPDTASPYVSPNECMARQEEWCDGECLGKSGDWYCDATIPQSCNGQGLAKGWVCTMRKKKSSSDASAQFCGTAVCNDLLHPIVPCDSVGYPCQLPKPTQAFCVQTECGPACIDNCWYTWPGWEPGP